MNPALCLLLITSYSIAIAFLLIWMCGATHERDPEPPVEPAPEPAAPRRRTMKIEALGRELRRFEILEHVAPDGEILEFHVPPRETVFDWTVDEVAELAAAISALPELETTL